MSSRQILVESTVTISKEHVTAELARKIYDRTWDVIQRTKDEKDAERMRFVTFKPWDNLEDAIRYFGMEPEFGEEGDLEFLDYIGGHDLQMILLEELAPFIRPGSVLTLLEEGSCASIADQDNNGLHQWFFDNKTVYWRPCIVMGIVTTPEDEDNRKAGRPTTFGPRYCAEEDCLHITIGGPGARCARCDEVPEE
jgi:hypothetical protein